MHRPFLLLATFILGTASIAAAIASTALAPPSTSKTSTESGDVALVQRYYAAVNELIETGDPTRLREIVHPEMIDLDPLAAEPAGPDAIERHAAYLHSVVPDTQIEPGHIAADGEQVIAQVTAQSASTSLPLGFTFDNLSVLWPPFEMFRVSGRQIVERQVSWHELAEIEPASAFPFTLNVPAQHTLDVTLSTYEPEATGVYLTADAPAILRPVSEVFSMTLASTAPESAFVSHPFSDDQLHSRSEVLPGQTQTFRPGDLLVVPPDSAFTVRNQGTRRNSVVSITIFVPADHGPEFESFALRDQYGITVRTLLREQTDELGAPARFSVGTVAMVPGNRLTVDPATSLMVLWAESGELATTSNTSSCGDAGFASGAPPDDDEQRPAGLYVLCPSKTSESMAVFNAGNEPATAWIIAVTANPSTS